jgi:hypothetical protein
MIPDYIGTVFLMFLFPILLFFSIGIQLSNMSILQAMKTTRELLFTSFLNLYGFYIAMVFIGYLWMLLIYGASSLFNLSMLEWFFNTQGSDYIWFRDFISLLPNAAGILFFIPILLCGYAIHFYSVIEIKEAIGLKEKLVSHQLFNKG